MSGGEPRVSLRTQKVLRDIAFERRRQDEKHGPIQDIPDGTGAPGSAQARDNAIALTDARAAKGTVTWHDVLQEEFMEAMAEKDPAALRVELIQTAAVCVKWVEHIDRRTQVATEARGDNA